VRRRQSLCPVIRCVPLDRLQSCRNIECGRDITCVDEGSRVRCVPRDGGGTPAPGDARCGGQMCAANERCIRNPTHGNYTCTGATFGRNCSELHCPPSASLCSQITIPSMRNKSVALCFNEESLTNLQRARQILENATCDKEKDLCESLDMICVDKLQGGKKVGFFCSLLNCTHREECLFDNECTELPEELTEILNSDHACMPTGNSLIFGSTCHTRNSLCPAGEVCTDTISEDMVATSYCTTERLPTLACADFTCPERNVCVKVTVGNEKF